jgi:protein involved in polysaccharide export with SLBB domain
MIGRTFALMAATFITASSSRLPGQAPGQRPLVLEPGDVVHIDVWREKDISGDYRVDESSRLIVPLLGIVPVANRPWYPLRDSLIAEYTKQLRNPSISLTPMRRVQVLGEVTKPGTYLADPTTSLAGLVALAGGATQYGDLRRIRVVRNGQTIIDGRAVEDLLMQSDIRSNDQLFVDRRPWIERNGAFVGSALVSAAGIVVALLRR